MKWVLGLFLTICSLIAASSGHAFDGKTKQNLRAVLNNHNFFARYEEDDCIEAISNQNDAEIYVTNICDVPVLLLIVRSGISSLESAGFESENSEFFEDQYVFPYSTVRLENFKFVLGGAGPLHGKPYVPPEKPSLKTFGYFE